MPVIFPAAIYLLGAALIPLFKGKSRKAFLISVALLALIDILLITPQTGWDFSFLGLNVVLLQADKLSLIVGYIFGLIGLLGVIYSLNAEESGLHMAAFIYIGSSLGAVFAGDLFSLYIFWELMALSSTMVIWAKRTPEATAIGFRYLIMHLAGGIILLAGIFLQYSNTGSISITQVKAGLPLLLFFLGIGLNAGFIPFHTWLPDAYPAAPFFGSVFMSVYTTKTAVYMLARVLPGIDAVAYMGAIMTVYGVSFALMQNNARRLLSYHIISQVGYMVAAIGLGSHMGINGGIFHLLNHIFYKALLFMCVGAVIYRTGIEDLTKLGGLTKKMPFTTIAVSIAALSISGMTFFNGFASKGMIFEAAHGNDLVYLLLELSAVGTFLSFLKLTYFGFFRKNDHIEAKEVPLNMQIAMGVVAFFCVLLGVFPSLIEGILPFPVPSDFHFYSVGHIFGVWMLLGITAVIFFTAKKYYEPHDRTTLDFDYFYLKIINLIGKLFNRFGTVSNWIDTIITNLLVNPWLPLANPNSLINKVEKELGIDVNKEKLPWQYGATYSFVEMCEKSAAIDAGVYNKVPDGGVTPVKNGGSFFEYFGAVDGLVNGVSAIIDSFSVKWRKYQTGLIQNYLFVMFVGIFVILSFYIFL